MDLSALSEIQEQLNRQIVDAAKSVTNAPGLSQLTEFLSQPHNQMLLSLMIPGGAGAMPIRDRLSALMESPLYFSMKPAERLALLKGGGGGSQMPNELGKAMAWNRMQMRLGDLFGFRDKAKLTALFGKHAAGK